MKTWKETTGLAMLATPGLAAALAVAADHHWGAWVAGIVGGIAVFGFLLTTTGGAK
jgi:hypothetical protein